MKKSIILPILALILAACASSAPAPRSGNAFVDTAGDTVTAITPRAAFRVQKMNCVGGEKGFTYTNVTLHAEGSAPQVATLASCDAREEVVAYVRLDTTKTVLKADSAKGKKGE